MNNHEDDWREVMRQFDEMFGAYRTDPRRFRLSGVNFMSPDRLGILDINDEVIEVSTGWFLDHRTFGVTWDRDDDDPTDDRSDSFRSLDEVREYLLTEDSGRPRTGDTPCSGAWACDGVDQSGSATTSHCACWWASTPTKANPCCQCGAVAS